MKVLKGSPSWQRVTVGVQEFLATKPGVGIEAGTPLKDWKTVTQIGIGPSGEVVRDGQKLGIPGRPWQGPREIRDLRWE